MTETPTEQADPKNRSGGAYLPKLPEGWTYSLALAGPDNQRIDLTPDSNAGVDGGYKVEVETGTGALTAVQADSLAEAAKMGVKAVKALAVVRTHRAAALVAEENFLAAIGKPSPRGEDGKLATPGRISGVNVESRGGKGVTVGPSAPAEPKDVDA
jgi:hypothetical protein